MTTPTTCPDPDTTAALCDAIVQGVVRAIDLHEDEYPFASEVMKGEVKALLTGEAYAEAREGVIDGSLHQGYVIGLVIATCVERIVARRQDEADLDGIAEAMLAEDEREARTTRPWQAF